MKMMILMIKMMFWIILILEFIAGFVLITVHCTQGLLIIEVGESMKMLGTKGIKPGQLHGRQCMISP